MVGDNKRKIKLISVESFSIGAGKTYLIKQILSKRPDIVYIPEPLEKWESYVNEDGQNILQLFYTFREKWSYDFQQCALLTRFKLLKETIENNPEGKIFITERSIFTDKNVFAKMLYDQKYICKIQYDMYNDWFDLLINNDLELSGIINVNTDIPLAMDRIKLRNRPGEEQIDTDYLQSLRKYQEQWFSTFDKSFPFINLSSDNINEAEDFIMSI